MLTGDDIPVDENLPGTGRLQAGHDVEHGALAASARTDHGNEFARLRREGDVVEDRPYLPAAEQKRLTYSAQFDLRGRCLNHASSYVPSNARG